VKGCFEILRCQHENRGRGKKKKIKIKRQSAPNQRPIGHAHSHIVEGLPGGF
jgi:hypothetical protein